MWKQTPPQKMAGSEQKKINQTKKKKPNTNTRCNNQNYSATQNTGFVPQPLTQQRTELLQQS